LYVQSIKNQQKIHITNCEKQKQRSNKSTKERTIAGIFVWALLLLHMTMIHTVTISLKLLLALKKHTLRSTVDINRGRRRAAAGGLISPDARIAWTEYTVEG